MKIIRHWFIASLVVLASCTEKPTIKADTIIAGRIWTGNEKMPWVEAMALSADTILAVGTREEMNVYVGEKTKTIEAGKNELITPGFIDSHTHFLDGGFKLASVQLRDVKTPEEFIRRMADYAAKQKPGTWILGGNWDHQNWGGQLPERSWIDSVTLNNPVWVNRLDGHMLLANSAALKAAGVTENVKDVTGGSIIRKNGKLTGLLKDNAKGLVENFVPAPGQEQTDVALAAAMNYVASNGITSIVSMTGTTSNDYFDVYDRARSQQKLITRVYAACMLEDWSRLAERIKKSGRGDDWFGTGALKGFVDGSLGSHTAAFKHAYSDSPTDSGFFVSNTDSLYHEIKTADSAGLQIFIHAIGDKSISTLLDIFARVAKENGPRDRRFRMEHAQHIDPADYSRFAELHVIPSMQPYHAIDDGRWAEKLIGHERAGNTYAFRSLFDANASVAFGSDWFVAPASVMEGIYAAVTRRTIDDKNPDGWIPEQKITVEEALKAYTSSAAYSIFQENKRGTLEAGKLADFVILEKDITKINPVDIQHVKVKKTFVGGKMVYNVER